jgi:hypothetical protein
LSVFYAYFFEEFWEAHRDEYIIAAISHTKLASPGMLLPSRTALKQRANPFWHPRELSKFIHKIQHRLVKTAMDRDGEQEEANSRTKKILFLCDGSLELAPQNMVVSEWSRWQLSLHATVDAWGTSEGDVVLDLGLDSAEIDQRMEIFGGTARYGLCCDEVKLSRAKRDLL